MAQITLTRNLASASVTVQVSGMTASERLMRTDRNGSRLVRLLAGQAPNEGVLIATDTEAALAGPIAYTAGTATATTRLDRMGYPFEGISRDQLHVVGLPFLAAEVLLTLDLNLSSASTSTEHPIIGRTDTVSALGPLALATGTIRYLAASEADAAAIREVYASGNVVMYRSAAAVEGQGEPPSRDLYHVGEQVAIDAAVTPIEGEQYWTVAVSVREKPVPTAPLAGSAGWTFDALTATGLTFDQLAATGITFNQLTLGPPA